MLTTISSSSLQLPGITNVEPVLALSLSDQSGGCCGWWHNKLWWGHSSYTASSNRGKQITAMYQWDLPSSGERGEKNHQNNVTFGSAKDTRSFYNIESSWTTVLWRITTVTMFLHGISYLYSKFILLCVVALTAKLSINSLKETTKQQTHHWRVRREY